MKITKDQLKEWSACRKGYEWFWVEQNAEKKDAKELDETRP